MPPIGILLKMKEAALRVQHDLMVKRNTELHNLDQMCKAATDRITELTHLQREARNVRNALDRTRVPTMVQRPSVYLLRHPNQLIPAAVHW